jgi:hypothetical protein
MAVRTVNPLEEAWMEIWWKATLSSEDEWMKTVL